MTHRPTLAAGAALAVAAAVAMPAAATDAAITRVATLDRTITGLLPVSPELAYVSTVDSVLGAALLAVDLTDGSVSVVHEGLPLGAPGELAPGPDGTLQLADWNSEESAACCDGRVFRVSLDPVAFTSIYDGGALAPTAGDPSVVLPSPGGAFPEGTFVLDFQGASPDDPFVALLPAAGAPAVFASDSVQWTEDHDLTDMTLAPSGAGFDPWMYLSERLGPGPELPGIFMVSPGGVVSRFADVSGPGPWAIEFAGVCGTTRLLAVTSDSVARVLAIGPGGVPEGTLVDDIPLGDLAIGRPRLAALDDGLVLLGVGNGLHLLRLCAGDLDRDCTVGFGDLVTLLAAWGPCDACDADLDDDGMVGLSDLLTVLATWGDCR